ncbi:hypothetical protein D3C79_859340 [compost metagenome]
MVDEAVEEHRPGRLCGAVAAMVIDVIEQAVLIFEFEVIPILAAHEHAALAVFEFQVVYAFEDLREGFTFLEVQAVVVIGT